jgi:hypothetical protein
MTADDLQPPSTPDAPLHFEPTAKRWTWIWLNEETVRGVYEPHIVDTSFKARAVGKNPHPGESSVIF